MLEANENKILCSLDDRFVRRRQTLARAPASQLRIHGDVYGFVGGGLAARGGAGRRGQRLRHLRLPGPSPRVQGRMVRSSRSPSPPSDSIDARYTASIRGRISRCAARISKWFAVLRCFYSTMWWYMKTTSGILCTELRA